MNAIRQMIRQLRFDVECLFLGHRWIWIPDVGPYCRRCERWRNP